MGEYKRKDEVGGKRKRETERQVGIKKRHTGEKRKKERQTDNEE